MDTLAKAAISVGITCALVALRRLILWDRQRVLKKQAAAGTKIRSGR